MSGPIPIVSFVGRSNSGKTTVLEKVIRELKGRGYRLAVIKHHYHTGLAFDVPGKDTYRFAQAGADRVIMAAPDQVVQVQHVEHELSLPEVVVDIRNVDLILTEGYKQADTPKIEVNRRERSSALLFSPDDLFAVISDQHFDTDTPQFGLDDAVGLVDLIERTYLRMPPATAPYKP